MEQAQVCIAGKPPTYSELLFLLGPVCHRSCVVHDSVLRLGCADTMLCKICTITFFFFFYKNKFYCKRRKDTKSTIKQIQNQTKKEAKYNTVIQFKKEAKKAYLSETSIPRNS